MNLEEQLGIKLSAFVAGIVGGIVSLTFETQLSFLRAILLIITGGTTAGYSFSLAEYYIQLPTSLSGIFGFTLGLTSMRIVTAIMLVANKIQKDPTLLFSITKFIASLKNEHNTGNTSSNSSDKPNILPPGENSDEGKPNN